MRIVRLVEKPSLRAASCCSVEVVNGGDGRRLRSFDCTSLTTRRPCADLHQRIARGMRVGFVGEVELLEFLAV